MEVILVEKIEKLGDVGDLVKVKNGFGRNFLLRQNKALRATAENKKFFEAQKQEILAKNDQIKADAKKIFNKLNNKQVIILAHASDEGRLFGSVMPRDVAAKLAEDNKIEIQKSQIILSDSIREVGIYEAKVRIHADYIALVKVNIARSEKEAKANIEAETKQDEVVDTAEKESAPAQTTQEQVAEVKS
ncbi:MAG: 50S ribosomal protein L9 [Rickettsiales bacterium]